MTIQNFIATNVVSDINGEKEFPIETWSRAIHKGTVLTDYGQVEKRGYFLQEGIVLCEIQRDGVERLVDVVFPGHFFCAYNSFISDRPSDIKVYALTDCKVEYLNKQDLKIAYEHSLVANAFGRYLKEKVLLKKMAREKDFLTKTKEEVYMELLEESPEIIRQVPIHKIAQYLGIHPESLSRIRKKLNS